MLDKDKQSPNQNKFDSGQAFLDKQFENLRTTSIFLFPIIFFLAFRVQDIFPFLFKDNLQMVLSIQILIWNVIFIYLIDLLLQIEWFLNKKVIGFLSFAIGIIAFGFVNSYFVARYPSSKCIILCTAILVSWAIMFIFNLLCLTRIGIKIPLYKSCEKPAIASMGLTIILRYADPLPFTLILLFGFIGYSLIFIITSWLEKEGI